MAEEKQPDPIEPTLSSDDMSVLRTLMHSIKGISAVSATATFTEFDDEDAA